MKTVGEFVKILKDLDQNKLVEFVFVDGRFRDTVYEYHNVMMNRENGKIAIMLNKGDK